MTVFNLVSRKGLARRPIVISFSLIGGLVLALGVIAQQNNRTGRTTSTKQETPAPALSSVQGSESSGEKKREPATVSQQFDKRYGQQFGEGEETDTYQLKNVDWRQFESSMVRTWGGQIRAEAEKQGRMMKVTLPTARNQRRPQSPEFSVVMRIDRVNNRLTYHGPRQYSQSWKKVITALDSQNLDQKASLVSMRHADAPVVQKAVNILTSHQTQENQTGDVRRAVRYENTARPNRMSVVSSLQDPQNPQDPANPQDDTSGVIGPVRIEVIPELGTIIVRGENPEDVKRVQDLINKLIGSAEESKPNLERITLKNANAELLAAQVQNLYDQSFQARQGAVTITPIKENNSLMAVGPVGAIDSVKQLVAELDVPTDQTSSDFKTYVLKNMSAVDAKNRIDAYFNSGQRTAPDGSTLQTVVTIADFRSNQLIVKASPIDLAQVDRLIEQLDTNGKPDSPTNVVKIFPLRNAVASELALVLQDAVNGQLTNAGNGVRPIGQGGVGGQGGGQGGGAGGQGGDVTQGAQVNADPNSVQSQVRSAQLRMMMLDKDGRLIESGYMFDVRITADANSNSLVVQGPEKSIPLLAELIGQLDRIPDVETQIKVFQILNGNAETLYNMLSALFNGQAGGGGGAGGQQGQSTLPLQNAAVTDGSTLANLRFTFEPRTNSIIASGSAGDLQVVYDLLTRLDVDEDVRNQQVNIYRLANAPAPDIAVVINEWLDSRQDFLDSVDTQGAIDFASARRNVTVIAEPYSNSLIIQALPEYIEEVERVIRTVDRRPPMVKVQVLIAEVTLGDTTEYGVEMGIQDSLLFDRGVGVVGFPFNQATLGNGADALSLGTRELLAGQALSNLGVGRTNTNAGYGGLVLSAGNESINILMRALKDRRRTRILATPQITTLDNLQGSVSVGEDVRFISESNVTNVGIQNTTEQVTVGVILSVTPRVSTDGTIVMAVDVTKSSLGAEEEGTVVSITNDGQVIRVPRINSTTAQTTIQAMSGQTVVFSGLIQESDSYAKRGLPILSDIPAIGPLFSFETRSRARTELLIVLTPHVLGSDEQVAHQNQIEMDRMHWCLADVTNNFGSMQYDPYAPTAKYGAPTMVYTPDMDPGAMRPQQRSQSTETIQNGGQGQMQNAGWNQVPGQSTQQQQPYQGMPQSNFAPVPFQGNPQQQQQMPANLSQPQRNSSKPIASFVPPNARTTTIRKQSYEQPQQNGGQTTAWPEQNTQSGQSTSQTTGQFPGR